MNVIRKLKERISRTVDDKVKRHLTLSAVFYVLALLLPAYVWQSGGVPIKGWECLWEGFSIWLPWSANVGLLLTWISMLFTRKWSLVPAAMTFGLAATVVAMDPDPAHYFAGAACWFFSMGVTVAYGLGQLKKREVRALVSTTEHRHLVGATPAQTEPERLTIDA